MILSTSISTSRLSAVLCLLCIGLSSNAQPIRIDPDSKVTSIAEHVEWTADVEEVWFANGLESCNELQSFKPFPRNSFVYREFTGPAIVRFELETTDLGENEFILEFRNTEIDLIQLYIEDEYGNSWKSDFIGDRLPFDQRYIDYRTLTIPLTLSDTTKYTCYIGLEKKNRIISTMIELYTKSEWSKVSTTKNLLYGLSFGFFVMVILIALTLFIIIKHRLYLYYTFYILCMLLMLGSFHGYNYQYLIPNNPGLQQYLMLIVLHGALIFGNLYSFEFIGFRHHNRFIQPLRYILVVIYTIGLFNATLYLDLGELLQKGINLFFVGIEIVNTLLLVGLSAWYIYKYKSQEAKVFLISFSFVGISVFYTNLTFLIDSMTFIPIGHSLLVGMLVEMTILTLFMVVQYKNTENQKILAENQIAVERMKNQEAFVNGQEVEKQRIAMNLHDNIGSSLLSLKLKVDENGNDKSLKQEISKISQDVRQISHELMPATLEDLGLVAATESLIQTNNTIQFHFKELSPTPDLPKEKAIQIYRVLQELIKNSYQHADAENVYIQFLSEGGAFEMSYEDDGKGFDPRQQSNGLGMKSIQTRVEVLAGTIKIESSKGNGFLAHLKVPVQNPPFGEKG